jgi:hypothetical protein
MLTTPTCAVVTHAALSCLFFLLGIVEGLVRMLHNVVSSIASTPAPVMSGENLCYDVIMLLWCVCFAPPIISA